MYRALQKAVFAWITHFRMTCYFNLTNNCKAENSFYTDLNGFLQFKRIIAGNQILFRILKDGEITIQGEKNHLNIMIILMKSSILQILGLFALISFTSAETFALINRKSGMAISQTGTSPGLAVQQEANNGYTNAEVYITPLTGDIVTIRNIGTNLYLTSPNDTPAAQMEWQSEETNFKNQEFVLDNSYADYKRIRNAENNLYLQVKVGSIDPDAPITQYYGNSSPSWERQQFTLVGV